jgi:hypothetical protein
MKQDQDVDRCTRRRRNDIEDEMGGEIGGEGKAGRHLAREIWYPDVGARARARFTPMQSWLDVVLYRFHNPVTRENDGRKT